MRFHRTTAFRWTLSFAAALAALGFAATTAATADTIKIGMI